MAHCTQYTLVLLIVNKSNRPIIAGEIQTDRANPKEKSLAKQFLTFLSDMKTFHGAAMNHVTLLSSVIVNKKRLSARYLLISVGFPRSAWLKLKPGDHINIFPENSDDIVNKVANACADTPRENEIVVWFGKTAIIC
jgi:hypothetical protein